MLRDYAQKASQDIVDKGFGAVDVTTKIARDGYHLIRWKGLPYLLHEPNVVEGYKDPMPALSLVCQGQYCERLDGCPHWYRYEWKAPTCVFSLKFVVAGNLEMVDYSVANGTVPANLASVVWYEKGNAKRDIKMVSQEARQIITAEKLARDTMDYTELEWENDEVMQAVEEVDSDEEEDQVMNEEEE